MQRRALSNKKMADVSTQCNDLSFIELKNNNASINQDYNLLKKQNQILKKELQKLSQRLDIQIKKRVDDNKIRPWVKPEDVLNMQLQNAYKKCQIYKKQASFYRKKFDCLAKAQKYQEYQKKTQEYAQQNNLLRQELKVLQKIQKIQERGLAENGAQVYLKTVTQNEKLHEEIRILKKQLDESRRQKKIHHQTKTQVSQIEMNNLPRESLAYSSNQNISKIKISRKKRVISQHSKHEDQNNVQNKNDKYTDKIKDLINQYDKLREIIKNYKQQLITKDKQIMSLKQKITFLRQNNEHIKKQMMKQAAIIQKYSENKKKNHYKIQKIPPIRKWKRSQSQINQKSNNQTKQKTNQQDLNQ